MELIEGLFVPFDIAHELTKFSLSVSLTKFETRIAEAYAALEAMLEAEGENLPYEMAEDWYSARDSVHWTMKLRCGLGNQEKNGYP